MHKLMMNKRMKDIGYFKRNEARDTSCKRYIK